MSLVLNGSGTITGLSAGGLPDSSVTTAELADAAVTQAKLAANVAGNGPAFSAYANTSQSTGAGATVKVQINTENFDTAGAFNNTGSTVGTAPSYSFNPQVAGYYQIQGIVSFSVNTSTTGCAAMIGKNGAVYLWGAVAGNASMYPSACVSDVVYLNGSTDYVELFSFNGTGGTANTIGQLEYSRFSGSLVRAA